MKRDYLFLSIITGLALFALIGGFMLIGSPAHSRALRFDEERLSDLGYMRGDIERFYQENKTLPDTLNELSSNSKEFSEDPETNEPYEYRITSDASYELCAIFATDPKGSTRDSYAPENSQYVKKGRSCIPYEVPLYLIPTQTQLPTIPSIEVYPEATDTLELE